MTVYQNKRDLFKHYVLPIPTVPIPPEFHWRKQKKWNTSNRIYAKVSMKRVLCDYCRDFIKKGDRNIVYEESKLYKGKVLTRRLHISCVLAYPQLVSYNKNVLLEIKELNR